MHARRANEGPSEIYISTKRGPCTGDLGILRLLQAARGFKWGSKWDCKGIPKGHGDNANDNGGGGDDDDIARGS